MKGKNFFSFTRTWTKPFAVFGFIFLMILMSARPAQAVPVEVTAGNITIGDWLLYGQQKELYVTDKAKETVDQGLLASGMAALINSFSFFMDKIAYDTATYVASGGKGQGALAFKDGFGSYLETTALDAVGDFIENFSEDALGVNLCQIPDFNVAISLTIGFQSIYGLGGPKSDCSWQDFRNNWSEEAFEEKYGPGGSRFLAETFSASLKVNNSDFGIALDTVARLDKIEARRRDSAAKEREEGQGFKPLTDLITGNVKTPAQLVKSETSLATNEYRVKASNEQLAGIAASGAKQVFVHAGSVFLNTLTSQLLNQILTKGFFGDESGGDEEGSAGVAGAFNSPLRRQDPSANPYAQLLTARPSPQVNNFDIVSEFATCPESPGVNNCVIDTDFQKILAAANTGETLTIQEALDKGWLHADWQLISPRRDIDNANPNHDCYLNKYCYSNIQKLRKVRILPLGFEVAALRSDPELPWTLGNVVRNFETCLRVNERGQTDQNGTIVKESSAYPFCHLINPNWVIRVPALICDAKVVGASLLTPNSPNRRQECVDVKTCINEGENGSCNGNYGYCTQEKNVWRLPGESCPAEYNTCTTYSNTKTGKVSSYLARTVDYGECSVDNVGCRAYSTEKNSKGEWLSTSDVAKRGAGYNALDKDFAANNALVFFDESIKSESSICRPGDNGCTALYPAQKEENGQYKKINNKFLEDTSTFIHLKKAPDYLGCYDADPRTLFGIGLVEWPNTLGEIQSTVSQNSACNAFASVCIESEVGCEAYNPLAGGPMIPGVVGAQNICAKECLGYGTFKQEAGDLAKFSHEKFPLFFIPSEGQTCQPEYAGCEEFTNIDSRSSGGENLEYYTDLKYCEKPSADGQNIKTFYTWEGSIREGLSLKTHRLLPVDQNAARYISNINFGADDDARITSQFEVGSPAYNDDSREAMMQNDSKCNEISYNLRVNNPFAEGVADPDCKAFYDDAGKVYYRLLGHTVTVAAACHPLRKTTAEFYIDETLQGQGDLCRSKGGIFNEQNTTCQRCMNGGRFENNACVYQTISRPGESTSCPAAANNCRAYTGSTANNLREVTNDDFEVASNATPEQAQALLQPWAPVASVRISPEATHPQLHSLEVRGDVSRTVASGTFANTAFYEVTFWAKGAGQTLEVTLLQKENGRDVVKSNFTANAVNGAASRISLGAEWQAYRLGPVSYAGNPGDMQLRFAITNGSNNPYYIDHVRLAQVRDYIYLIKDSWKTAEGYDAPLSCDSAPEDGLPGEALGCAAYRDSKQQVRYATGFEKLCREKAVGCEPFWDTRNTVSGDNADKKQVFNALCDKTTGRIQGSTCTLATNALNGRPGRDVGQCTIPQGASSCYIQKITVESTPSLFEMFPQGIIVTSTMVVLADTPSSTPIFLANRKEFQCNESARGCMAVGIEQQTLSAETSSTSFKYADVMIKNDPAKYSETLCRSDLVGCSEYKSSGNISYFKDPTVTGNKICTYQPQSEGSQAFGWFQDGVGTCSANAQRLCKNSDDCGGQGTCENIGKVACYPGYQREGGLNDIWSNNATTSYKGFVGSCPSRYNQCTQLVDPADTSVANPNGLPYYVIYNKALLSKSGECNGKVSLNDGCVLFNKTDDPNKLFNSILTYQASVSTTPRYGSVTPNKTGVLDTNLILKVDRDRMCSRWLQCSTKVRVTDESGKSSTLCYAFRECEQAVGDTCVKWVDDFENNKNIQAASSRLTYGRFINRGTSWYDPEFTGYSIYNKYRIDDMIYLTFDFQRLKTDGYLDSNDLKGLNDKQYIAYQIDNQFFAPGSGFENLGCSTGNGNESSDFKVCGLNSGGRCYNEKCLYPTGADRFPNDALAKVNNAPNQAGMRKILAALASDSNLCKGYPEESSPFPTNVVPTGDNARTEQVQNAIGRAGSHPKRIIFKDAKPGYDNVNVCQDGNCSCSYDKLTYKSGQVDYWTAGNTDSPYSRVIKGICDGGMRAGDSYDGKLCDQDSQCGQEPADDRDALNAQGKCQLLTKIENQYGFKGYCLEYDLSRPLDNPDQPFECLTWLPIQVSASNYDSYNSNEKAGYYQPLDAADGLGEVYCSVASRTAAGPYDETKIDPAFTNGDKNPTNYYNQFFDQNGVPKVSPSESCVEVCGNNPGNQNCRIVCTPVPGFCGGLVNGRPPYETAICDHSVPKIYTALQSFLWKDPTTRNSVILRIEHGDANSFDNNRWGHISDVGDDDNRVLVPAEIMYSFAPNTFQDQNEFGALLHPPRFWPDGREPGLSTGYRHDNLVAKPRVFDSDRLNGSILETRSFSPTLALNERTISSAVYRSPFESEIHESDIKRIRFFPLSYDDDSIGEMPMLMQSIDLNFDGLRDNPREAMADLVNDVVGGAEKQFPTVQKAVDDSVVWSYVIRRGEGGNGGNGIGLEDFDLTDYNVFTRIPNQEQEVSAAAALPDNEIATRYVVVYTDWHKESDSVPGFVVNHVPKVAEGDSIIQNQVTKASPDTDPFRNDCGGEGAANTNWLAIGMDFNEKGQFLGYISRWCNNGGTDSGIQFATVAELNDKCTEFVQVYDKSVPNRLFDTTNKAWTQRVWVDSKKMVQNNLVTLSHPMSSALLNRVYANLKSDVGLRPFGALNMEATSLDDADTLRAASFTKPYSANHPFGIPYSCIDNWLASAPFGSFINANARDNNAKRCQGVFLSGGNANQIKSDISVVTDADVARKAINQLFAKTFKVVDVPYRLDNGRVIPSNLITETWQQNLRAKDLSGNPDNDYRRDEFEDHDLMAPQIYSLDPVRCRQKGVTCTAGEANNVSVNFRNGTLTDYDGDGFSDEDSDGDRVADDIIQPSSLTAFLNFFAYADDNRMPIRRVMVDWGDGTTINSNRKGLYRNHKPYCEPDEGPQKFCGRGADPTATQKNAVMRGLACATSSDCPEEAAGDTCVNVESAFGKRFGSDEDRACTEGYFEFVHEYSCSRSDIPLNGGQPAPGKDHVVRIDSGRINEGTRQKLLGLGLQPDGFVCIYQPKVQVLDNWGWCNGSCNGGKGCYADGAIDFCQDLNQFGSYTPYRGAIIVIPPPPLLQGQQPGR